MSEVRPIQSPLPGERVVALSPGNAADAATDWLRRPHLFAGRALGVETLAARQRWIAGRLAQRGQAFTAGVVRGLEVTHRLEQDSVGDPRVRLRIEPGQALAASGEDITLLQPITCLLGELPVLAPPAWFEAAAPEPDAPSNPTDPTEPTEPTDARVGDENPVARAIPGRTSRIEPAPLAETLNARTIGSLTLAQLLPVAGARMSRIGVLVAQPVRVQVADFDRTSPCDRCPCGDAAAEEGEDAGGDSIASVEDWREADALRLLWYPWPEEWQPLPATTLRLRNALAHLIFGVEARLALDQVLPWCAHGVPLALIALDADAAVGVATAAEPRFSDRASVVRQGGRARDARLAVLPDGRLHADSRLPALWQARIEQFAEQLAELGDPPPPADQLADPFVMLPPCGLLPRAALDLTNLNALRSDFFPPAPLAVLDAVPVPLEQIDTLVRECAAMAPIDLTAPGRVRILVPVPQANWEARLLKREVIDPEFDATLQRFLLRRARELGARQGLRTELALLTRTLTGEPQTVIAFNDDPQAVEPESLQPWGPPPVGGGHRSTLRAGAHQHFFDNATETLTPAAGEALAVWVLLDADNPPRGLMLQWHVAGGNWEHRAIWGEDLANLGVPNTAGRRLMGPLPEAGRWLQLEVPAPLLDLQGRVVDGMAFYLYDGRAAWGMAGVRGANRSPKWFCNVLPLGARPQGDEPWDLLTQNDLWAPFEPARGVVPAIPSSVPAAAAGITNGGHLEPSALGTHQHFFDSASQPFSVTAGELLYAWVYIDPNDPPRQVMLQWLAGNWNHRAYWGFDHIPWGAANTVERRRIGGLPLPGQWVRLTVNPADVGIAAGAAITGIAFTLFNGSAAFAACGAGTVTQSSNSPGGATIIGFSERPWFAGALPAGTVRAFGAWVFFEERDLYAPTTTSRIGRVQSVAELLADPLLSALSEQERAQLTVRGLGPFVDYLRQRIDRIDDLTDYGFVKMQSDIYRVRQLMLSTSDATRLAVSPTLASIAKAETAVASQAQIANYMAEIKRARVADAVASSDTRAASVAATGAGAASTASAAAASAASVAALSPALGGTFAGTPKAVTAARAAGVVSMVGAPAAVSPVSAVAARSTFEPIFVANQFRPTDVLLAAPIIGKSPIRTTAIADRLRQSASQEARDYALATRQEAIRRLIELIDEFTAEDGGMLSGLFSGFEVYGLLNDPFLANAPEPQRTARRRPLTDLLADRTLLARLLDSPTHTDGQSQNDTTDESTLFSETAALSDNTVAVLRQLEGRIKRYRDALTRCELALTALQADRADAGARLAAAGDRLAEARHDVGVARALIAEEQARLDAINARRAQVIADEVKFLAFVRPREGQPMRASPLHRVDPALAEAPVPQCLREHGDVPDELDDMLRTVREAPAAWFVDAPKLLKLLDRHDLLLRTLGAAQQRIPLVAQRLGGLAAAVATPTAAARTLAPKLAGAVAHVVARQTPALAARVEAVQRIDLTRAAGLTWAALHQQTQDVVSLGDMIDGDHGRGVVSSQTAALFDRVSAICTCLHAEFCAVSASIRLDWAEAMSQYDAAPSLRNAGNLPRFAELDSTDRRQIQAYIDWLFAQVDPQRREAVALVDDLVRMALLLASHAPVNRIVAGRLPRPVVGVRPGVRIPLTLLDAADKLRVGMQALVYRGSELVARAAVDDLGSGEVSAVVTHASRDTLDTDVRVQFAAAETVAAAVAKTAAMAATSSAKTAQAVAKGVLARAMLR